MAEWSVAERQAISRLKFKFQIEAKREASQNGTVGSVLTKAERIYLETYGDEVERADLERVCTRLAMEDDDRDAIRDVLLASAR